MAILRGILRDFLDQSATPRSNPNWIAEGLTTAGVGIVGAGGFWNLVEKVVKPILGDWVSFFQFLLIIVAILWCGSLVCAKVKVPEKREPNPAPNVEYQFSQPIRILSKLVLIVFICVLPVKARNLYYDIQPLPRELYGVLENPLGQPITNGTVIILNSGDESITANYSGPDSNGFYHIVATRRISRSDHLKFVLDSCNVTLQLDHAHQIAAKRESTTGQILSPMFSHTVNCPEDK